MSENLTVEQLVSAPLHLAGPKRVRIVEAGGRSASSPVPFNCLPFSTEYSASRYDAAPSFSTAVSAGLDTETAKNGDPNDCLPDWLQLGRAYQGFCPFSPDWGHLREDSVPRIRYSSVPEEHFFTHFVRLRRPCVLTLTEEDLDAHDGLSKFRPMLSNWTDTEYLKTAAGHCIVTAKAYALAQPLSSFLDALMDDKSTAPATRCPDINPNSVAALLSQYHHKSTFPMRFSDFLDILHNEQVQCCLIPPSTRFLTLGDQLIMNTSLCADFPKIPSLFKTLVPYWYHLWLGRTATTPFPALRHHFHDHLYIALKGRQRIRLFSPRCAELLIDKQPITRIHPNGLVSYHPTLRSDTVDRRTVYSWRLQQVKRELYMLKERVKTLERENVFLSEYIQEFICPSSGDKTVKRKGRKKSSLKRKVDGILTEGFAKKLTKLGPTRGKKLFEQELDSREKSIHAIKEYIEDAQKRHRFFKLALHELMPPEVPASTADASSAKRKTLPEGRLRDAQAASFSGELLPNDRGPCKEGDDEWDTVSINVADDSTEDPVSHETAVPVSEPTTPLGPSGASGSSVENDAERSTDGSMDDASVDDLWSSPSVSQEEICPFVYELPLTTTSTPSSARGIPVGRFPRDVYVEKDADHSRTNAQRHLLHHYLEVDLSPMEMLYIPASWLYEAVPYCVENGKQESEDHHPQKDIDRGVSPFCGGEPQEYMGFSYWFYPPFVPHPKGADANALSPSFDHPYEDTFCRQRFDRIQQLMESEPILWPAATETVTQDDGLLHLMALIQSLPRAALHRAYTDNDSATETPEAPATNTPVETPSSSFTAHIETAQTSTAFSV